MTDTDPQDWPSYIEDARCLVHMTEFDEDCEHCQAETAALQRFLDKIQGRNNAAEQRIAFLGRTISLDGVLMMRLNVLIDLMLQNPKMRGRFEISYAIACEDALRNTEQMVSQQRLTQGIILPGQP